MMIPRADLATTVQPVAAVDAPTAVISVADAKQEAFSRLAQIAIGQQLQGKVLSTYNDGSYLVRLANTAARMVLPSATKTGDNLLLTLVGKEPRPTFLLNALLNAGSAEEENDYAVSINTRLMEKDLQSLKPATRQALPTVVVREGQAGDEGRGHIGPSPAPVLPESSKTSLSAAGRLVDSLLHASEESELPSAIKAAAPLVGQPTDSIRLAIALHDAITLSGVFYEAHVAAWAEGKRPLSELHKEPQTQFARPVHSESAPNLLTSTDPAHTQLGQIIHLQLNALEQQRIVWQGEVWPGQAMEWEIGQDSSETPQQGEPHDDDRPPSWHSVVRFHFTHLGDVSASIRLIGAQIHIHISTGNDSTAATLRANGSMLAEAMAAAGSSLDALIVKQDGQA